LYPEKLLSLAITNLLEGKKVPIYGTGDQVREWLYVEDHCRGIEAILQKGTAGETYFIGPGEQRVTNLELIRKVLGMMGKNENSMEFVADRPGHDQRYALSIAKIERELDWHPTVLLDEGLQKMIDWYTQNESWWKPIKSGDYKKYYAQHYGTRG
jgi:dTDP-glucose 4,6-dehydratase